MRITSLDVLALASGIVAVVFSGFVLTHSPWGGVALLAGGTVALLTPALRDRRPGVAPLVWIVFLSLLGAGLAGFLVGFGAFDDPDLRTDVEATLHDDRTHDSTVIVTGSVRNVGGAPAETATVTIRLYDVDGNELRRDEVALETIAVDAEQLFFVRFEAHEELSAFDSIEVDASADP